MIRTYVLDTSVLLADPNALFQFDEHDIVLPLVVIKELESKRSDSLVGFQARTTLRTLEDLSDGGALNLRDGVPLGDGLGTVRVEINHISTSGLPEPLQSDRSHDTRILAVAKNLTVENAETVLVTRDLPLRLLAQSVQVTAQDYRADQADREGPDGITVIDAPADTLSTLARDGVVSIDGLEGAAQNTGLVLRGPSGGSLLAVADRGQARKVTPTEVFGLKGRSAEQHIAIDHLMNPDVGVVSLSGNAGTGKTLLALAAGLEQVMERKEYARVVVFRPLHAVGGQEVGYLPGTLEDKMTEPARAIHDAMEALTGPQVIEEIIERNMLEVLPVTHIRGRTLTNTFVIIDEAQNLEQQVLLSVLSRTGQGTKMVLCWDAAQRDNLHVGRHDGISVVAQRLHGEPLFAHTALVKSERSAVAEMVTRCLA